jgi:hypothetical protein
MAVLKYRDPATGQFVDFIGGPGAPGATGPTGPVAVSADAGNEVKMGTGINYGILVNTLPMTPEAANARYVKLAGDTVTGYLYVPAPAAGAHIATKTYVDTKFNATSKVWVQPAAPTTPSIGDILLRT